MNCNPTDFDVDSSSRFLFERGQENGQTQLNALSHGGGYIQPAWDNDTFTVQESAVQDAN